MVLDSIKTTNKLLLKTVPLFSALNDTEVDWFLERSKLNSYRKNQLIYQHGDHAGFLYVVLEGWIKLFHDNIEGEQTVQSLLTRGDSFGEECVVAGRSYSSSAQFVGKEGKCLLVSAQTLREAVSNYPNIALNMIASLTNQLNKSGYLLEISSKLTTAQRVAAFLLKLSLDRGGVKHLTLPYNKYLVAERLGMRPETYSRAMRRLEEDLNIKFRGREVFLDDLFMLQAYSEVYCSSDKECSIKEKLLCSNPECDIRRILNFM